ncbi:MAG: DUF222 domain-containing protein, partial [Acidimicrobiia bacterium]|nr:DUF222 domain-containing protein [Acidimicrobiia bacterium]
GMFVLTGEFDQITGARIATALTAKERQLWNREDPNKRATPQQRMADALAELISEPTGDGRSVGTDLLVIADFDVLKQQLENRRLVDGSPIPITELHKLALEANLLPSIFDTKTQDMWLGRRLRTATEAQRIALIARDQCCIGCGANPLWCQAHHIIWWSNNGPTNLENLVLVCNDCHHKIHDEGWQVHKHPDTGKYHLKPPTHPTNERPVVSSDKPTRNSLGEPTTQPSGQRPTTPPHKPSTNPSGESPAASEAEAPTISSGERPTGPPDKPSTRPSGEHPVASLDKSARTLPDEPSTHPADKRPTLSVGEPLSGPANKRPTVLSDTPASTASGRPPNRQSGERPTVLSDKSARTSPHGSSTSGPGDSLDVSVSEPSTHPADKRPTNSSKTLSRARSVVSSEKLPAFSSGRADRARTREDSTQSDSSDPTQLTFQNAPGFAPGEQVQRKNQTNSNTKKQNPTTRTTRHDPVDSIDTS